MPALIVILSNIKTKSVVRFPIFNFIVLSFILLTISSSLFSQDYNRANIWYFGEYAGVDFNSGQATAIYNGQVVFGGIWRGPSVMCDTNGELLFYTQGDRIWDRNHDFIDPTFLPASYDVVCFPMPGSNNKYYVFAAPGYNPPQTLGKTYYAIIDMELNGGLGGVSDTFRLDAAWDTGNKIAAVKHKNKEDVWVIYRMMNQSMYAAFLISSDSVHTQPVFSPAPYYNYYNFMQLEGQSKISYDKKYLFYSYCGGMSPVFNDDKIEICKFNCETGEIGFLYSIKIRDNNMQSHNALNGGVEFSPDSKYAYISANNTDTDSGFLYQYDMQLIEDSADFVQSKTLVGAGERLEGMQLGRDGKIYITADHAQTNNTPYLSIIHEPWNLGTECNFQNEGLYLTPKVGHSKLTNELLDYLYRFDFEGICEDDTFHFDPWFIPEPTYIQWDFGDILSGANNTSTIPHATHKFTDGGTYEVSVHVEYPSGRIEETSRKVEVEYSPEPDLGTDTIVCYNNDIILNAECGEHFYTWSTGAFGSSQITVSDTGWYWVRVENNAGCFEIDSIHLSNFSPILADTNNLQVIPTTCGGSMGAVKGLEIIGSPPLSYVWTDDLGDTISYNLDIYHLAVGNYTLHITDGNNCITTFDPYTIHDAGDVLIEDVTYSSGYCDQQNGSITVTATSGLADMLFYSLDNGATYFSNQGIFTGLSAGSYAVRVKDSTDCQDVYLYNPIIIENIPGPQIDNVLVTPSIVGQNNGALEIIASGSSDTLYFSNDDGFSYQINNGWFTNLPPGFYNCVVMDENGCDTTFIVEVTEETILRLQAIAGDDEACPGNAAFIPLIVTNFQDVATFRANLLYNNTLLDCQGYANANTQLEDSLEVIVFPAEGRIELSWSSTSVTLPQQSILTDLVFSSTIPGINQIEWDGQPGSSYFLNSLGDNIPVDYYMGNVKIYNEVSVELEPYIEACEGEDITITPHLLSSNGEVNYLWTYPNGDTSQQQTQYLNNIQLGSSGIYQLSVFDTAQCTTEEAISISVFENPIPAFSEQDTISTEVPVEIDAGANHETYNWTTGETSQFITAVYEGWYGVFIESLQGCYGEDSVYVLFTTPPPLEPQDNLIFIPNAFSPNEDGLNDVFKAITTSSQITSFHMYIYNRWGEQIFESSDISQGWDGKYKGKPGPTGAYVYKIEYMLSNIPEGQTISGVVVLVK